MLRKALAAHPAGMRARNARVPTSRNIVPTLASKGRRRCWPTSSDPPTYRHRVCIAATSQRWHWTFGRLRHNGERQRRIDGYYGAAAARRGVSIIRGWDSDTPPHKSRAVTEVAIRDSRRALKRSLLASRQTIQRLKVVALAGACARVSEGQSGMHLRATGSNDSIASHVQTRACIQLSRMIAQAS
jgi:hypothetical protein